MSKPYTMKDLGYPRTPTSAQYRVTMEDGSQWDVPVQVIVDSRDENYSDDKEDTVAFIRDDSLDNGDIADWASNNMNWCDVAEYAVRVDAKPKYSEFQVGWVNGQKRIVGQL